MTGHVAPEDVSPLGSDTTRLARRHILEALAGGVVLVAAWVTIAVSRTVPPLEEAVFRVINGLPDWIEYVGWPVMQFGAMLAIPIVALAAARLFRSIRVGAEILLAGGAVWIAARVIKVLAGRERPSGLLTDIELRPLWHGLGFPSGHSAVAAAMAAVLSVWVRGWWLAAVWAVPVVVGFMRIYTAAHFPLDVIAGWGLGALVGTGVAGLGRVWATRRAGGS